jgi:vacuolar-type H+-ATPase subunit I/STV1
MVNQAHVRNVLRWIHIAAGIFLVGYVYKFHSDANATGVGQKVVIPAIAVSGLWLWQQGRIVRWIRRVPAPSQQPTRTANG